MINISSVTIKIVRYLGGGSSVPSGSIHDLHDKYMTRDLSVENQPNLSCTVYSVQCTMDTIKIFQNSGTSMSQPFNTSNIFVSNLLYSFQSPQFIFIFF